MPSTATITAFYSFTANTKARASQVNGNFDVFRGHLLPIDPNTQTAISNTYDLGSSDYRWKALYLPATTGTLTAAVGGFALGATMLATDFNTASSSHMAFTTVTISTIGRPVMYSFMPTIGNPASASYIGVGVTSTTDAAYTIVLCRDGVTISSLQVDAPAGNVLARYHPPGAFTFIDNPPAGTYNYSVKAHISAGTVRNAAFNRVTAYAKEF